MKREAENNLRKIVFLVTLPVIISVIWPIYQHFEIGNYIASALHKIDNTLRPLF